MYEPVWDDKEDGGGAGPGEPSHHTREPPLVSRTMKTQTVKIVASRSLGLSSYAELLMLLQQRASSFTEGDPRDLIQIKPPALCSVCYNLDPYEAPPDRSGRDAKWAWPRDEYALLPGMPIAKITVRKSAELLESAQRGCLTCTMISASLSGVSPGWDEGTSYMHLCLAPTLPLVVRLHPGGTTESLTQGRQALLDLGVVMPEGSTIDWEIEITVSDDKAGPQPLEIEIYRRNVAPGQSTVGGTLLAPWIPTRT